MPSMFRWGGKLISNAFTRHLSLARSSSVSALDGMCTIPIGGPGTGNGFIGAGQVGAGGVIAGRAKGSEPDPSQIRGSALCTAASIRRGWGTSAGGVGLVGEL